LWLGPSRNRPVTQKIILMKKVFSLLVPVLMALTGAAQLNPVNWSFTSKKIDARTYEVHLTATIQAGWHLYSQAQPDNAVAEPTKFEFAKNPILALDGKVKEQGSLEKFHDEKLDISANQYSQQVNFVQVVKLKLKGKTNLSGSVRFQTCNDEKCLPPKTVKFAVALM
jgi:thiol:disulfide interchange protein DsbD